LARWAVTADAIICLLTDEVSADLLDTARNLKIVANAAVGYENIDIEAAVRRGIVVTNTPEVLTEATADLTFALLLAAARHVAEADAWVRHGRFPPCALQQPLTGAAVHGKTLGIIGMGRIGAAVARRGHLGFGMRVVYFSRSEHPSVEVELNATRMPLEELLSEADYVCVHVPLTEETHHMLDAEALSRMRSSAILVNVSRGAVLDEEALVQALQENVIAGAALDVFENEPEVHPGLLACTNVVLSPHLGSATLETRRAMADIAVDNVLAVLAGKPPRTSVTGSSPTGTA
jgi:glyoxylate reductase